MRSGHERDIAILIGRDQVCMENTSVQRNSGARGIGLADQSGGGEGPLAIDLVDEAPHAVARDLQEFARQGCAAEVQQEIKILCGERIRGALDLRDTAEFWQVLPLRSGDERCWLASDHQGGQFHSLQRE